MKASDFEYGHQLLLHLLVTGTAVTTYLLSPDDIVWALVRHHPNSAFLERLSFGVGALLLLCCAALETWAYAYAQPDNISAALPLAPGPYLNIRYPLRISRLLFAFALGLLLLFRAPFY